MTPFPKQDKRKAKGKGKEQGQAMSGRGGGAANGKPAKRSKAQHKGERRQYITEARSPAEEEEMMRRREKKDGDDDPENAAPAGEERIAFRTYNDEDDDDDDDDEKEHKAKGLEGIVEVSNPNRVVRNVPAAAPQLSRKEREELEAQQKHDNFLRMTGQGKTEQGRADLERLEQIRRQRAEAAQRRQQETQERDAAKVKAKGRAGAATTPTFTATK
eukprot:TRINITY_DN54_c0_g1_i1.p1 TRINITY_DN54_c0_g1~~TRINITY_DN54_c0_g1_i1.p1  ORF type:complete len:216 (-),score=79.38 TRINITY_DN54_c0_g1_i1:91-738(-)